MKAPHFHHNPALMILAVTLFIIAFIIRWKIGQRRFNRRGIAGLQQFRSYSCAVFTTLAENFLLFIATAFTVIALISIVIYYFG